MVLLLELALQREVLVGDLHDLALFYSLFQHRDLRVVVCLLDQDFVLFLLEVLNSLLGVCDAPLVLFELRLDLHLSETKVYVKL